MDKFLGQRSCAQEIRRIPFASLPTAINLVVRFILDGFHGSGAVLSTGASPITVESEVTPRGATVR